MDAATVDLDAIFAPYEARPATVDATERERREVGLRFGWELNRLQGGACGRRSICDWMGFISTAPFQSMSILR
jgi:hypothetical protein